MWWRVTRVPRHELVLHVGVPEACTIKLCPKSRGRSTVRDRRDKRASRSGGGNLGTVKVLRVQACRDEPIDDYVVPEGTICSFAA